MNIDTTTTTTITTTTTTTNDNEVPLVIQDLQRYLKRNGSSNTTTTTTGSTSPSIDETSHPIIATALDTNATAVPVAAIEALLDVVKRSTAETMMGLQNELKVASDLIIQYHSTSTTSTGSNDNNAGSNYNYYYQPPTNLIALRSGCELFMKYVTRTYLEVPDFQDCLASIISRGQQYQQISKHARDQIAVVGCDFVPNGGTILLHGISRVVASILLYAHTYQNKNFDLIILEGRPDCSGVLAASYYSSIFNNNSSTTTNNNNIPVSIVVDSAMGYVMEQIDIVLVGAEGVMENGGILNKIGTLSIAACAATFGKPFYVAVESYKFARLYPLSQQDVVSTLTIPPTITTGTTSTPNPSSQQSYQPPPVPLLQFVNTTVAPLSTDDILKTTTTTTTVNPITTSTRDNNTTGNMDTVMTSSTTTGPVVIQDIDDENNKSSTQHVPSQQQQQQQQPYYLPVIPYDTTKIQIQNPNVDFTPSKFITLLFTDLGVLTPSAVSDELIRLYQ